MEAEAIVNSSLSEGLSNVLLETMLLRVPILARDIEGNRSIISQGETGLLFDSPTNFHQHAERLSDDSALRESLIENAWTFVTTRHSPKSEREAYQALFHPQASHPSRNRPL